MIEIECPNCQGIRKMSLVQPTFEGPYRCWKCRSLFIIRIAYQKVQSWEPMTEEEYEKWQKEQEDLKKQTDG